MEPQTLAEFFSPFPGTVFPKTISINIKHSSQKTMQPSLYNQSLYRFDLPKKQQLRKPSPRSLAKLRMLLKYKTQREIAQSIGVSPTTLSCYANDRGKVAGWDEMDAKVESYVVECSSVNALYLQ